MTSVPLDIYVELLSGGDYERPKVQVCKCIAGVELILG